MSRLATTWSLGIGSLLLEKGSSADFIFQATKDFVNI